MDSRLETYRKLSAADVDAAKAELDHSIQLQEAIWSQAVIAGQREGAPPAAPMLLLPALNQMFDITTTRTMALRMHPPVVVFVMLFGLALASALLAGHAMGGGKTREWLHMLAFAAVVAITVYVIFDLEYPRLGLIRIDAFDQVLADVRASMK